MTITVTLDEVTSTTSSHTATRYPATGVGAGLWSVSWLPGRILTRDEATTAIRIAELADDFDETSLSCLSRWAYELGLDATQAWDIVNSATPATPVGAHR
ncbi:hypothetical protein PV646_28650 [Streptomyces sp. ID05-26A]|nr:hypothetical protein [Streptomyces sp. ID05-26A]